MIVAQEEPGRIDTDFVGQQLKQKVLFAEHDDAKLAGFRAGFKGKPSKVPLRFSSQLARQVWLTHWQNGARRRQVDLK